MKLSGLPARAKTFVTDVTDFPVLPTAATLWERFQQDRLGLTASSLTFTTTLALVPFFAVVLAIFTAFPIFGQLKGALEQWLIESLIPTSIARNVLDYLTQFAVDEQALRQRLQPVLAAGHQDQRMAPGGQAVCVDGANAG